MCYDLCNVRAGVMVILFGVLCCDIGMVCVQHVATHYVVWWLTHACTLLCFCVAH